MIPKDFPQVLEQAARTKRKSRRKRRRRKRPHKKPVEVVSINDESQKNKSQYLKVSNFIEEEVVYYEESFPGEFDDGVVVDYEEIPFDEQVPSLLLLFFKFLLFSELLL